MHQTVSGAGGDLQQVERMARAMVTQFGMSDVGTSTSDRCGFHGVRCGVGKYVGIFRRFFVVYNIGIF